MVLEHSWGSYEDTLVRVKHSCFAMHALYRRRYLISRAQMVRYDVPIIVLSAVTSVFIAGADGFVEPKIVQVTTCVMSLFVSIIGALKKFFRVDENRENCLETYKDMFRVFCELSIILDQPEDSRGVDPQKYTTEVTNRYAEIMDRAIVLEDYRTMENPIYDDRNPMDRKIKKKFSLGPGNLPPLPRAVSISSRSPLSRDASPGPEIV